MNMPSPDPLISRKRDLRRAMIATRMKSAAENPAASLALRDHFLKQISIPAGSVVSAYNALEHEMNPAPLVEALRAHGHTVVFPVTGPRHTLLIFRAVESGGKFITGAMGIPEPPPSAPQLDPDILLTPLLAFDRSYARLGYGGGYYDRTLHDLRSRKSIMAVGIAFASQEMTEVPTAPYDAKLDKIATESGVF